MKKHLINLAKDLDFKTENEYFDYIIQSKILGHPQQVRNLIADMKKLDRLNFLRYCEECESQYYSDFAETITML